MRQRILFPLMAGVLTTLASACATLPLPLGREYGRKMVVGKEAPNVLLADDGTRCQVSRATFANTAPRGEATCVWRPNDAADRRLGGAASGAGQLR